MTIKQRIISHNRIIYIISLFTISIAQACILFIFLPHYKTFSVFNCSINTRISKHSYVRSSISVSVQIEALIDYVHLFYQENTAEARKDILIEQRDRLQKQIDAMNIVIERLNKKVDRYEEIIIPAEKKLLNK